MISFKDFLEDLSKIPKEEQPVFLFEFFKLKSRLHLFGQYFLSHIISTDPETCHIDLLRELSSDDDSAIIFPRGFGKTTWEKIDTIHDIVYALEPVILYISNILQDAKNHFESIKGELETNEILHAVYGNLSINIAKDKRLSKWNAVMFETSNGINLVARGAGKGRGINIKNRRPTKIIIDDGEDDQMVRTLEQRMKYEEWVLRVIIPSLDPLRGKLKVIGTVISHQCFVLKFYHDVGGLFKRAIENGESIWQSVFPVERLHVIRDGGIDPIKNKKVKGIGTRAFEQEYMNNATDEENSIIKREWLEQARYSTLHESKKMNVVVVFDPQSGESKTADYYGLAVVGWYTGDKHRYLLEVQTGRKGQLAQACLFVQTVLRYRNQWTKYHVHVCGIEKVMAQVAVYQLVLDWINRTIEFGEVKEENRNLPFKHLEPKGKDKIARLQMHEAKIERGEFHIHETQNSFLDRLVMFPDLDHDDDIDAVMYALEQSYFGEVEKKEEKKENAEQKTISGNLRNKQW